MENHQAHYAALAGLSGVLRDFEVEFSSRIPFPLLEMKEEASKAKELAMAGETPGKTGDTRLQSIFSLLNIQKKSAPDEAPRYLAARSLSLQQDVNDQVPIFPVDAGAAIDVQAEQQDRWNEVSNGMEALRDVHSKQADIETYLEGLAQLLQRELWSMPSGFPGVSVYDYARTTAALTVCLASQNNGQEIAALVGGDISGIQNFIYTITSKGAASALRGRSLYLQLLTEAIARDVLKQLDLPVMNLLFAGGGHFFILARSGSDLTAIREKISRILLSLHGGELYLALESVPLAEQDFAGMALTKKWSDLSARLREAKLHKFSDLKGSLYSLVFAPRRDQGNLSKECAVCGREHPGTKPRNGRLICPQCHSYEELGKDLRKAHFLRLSQVKSDEPGMEEPPRDVHAALACFGWQIRLYDSHRALRSDMEESGGPAPSIVYALRDDALGEVENRYNMAAGRRFLINVTPAILDEKERQRLVEAGVHASDLPQPGDVKPFEALEAESQGIRRVGVLRMDVDDMGKIISEGLGQQAKLARLAALSFMLNLFFEGWTAELARKYNRDGGADKDSVYSIYSGGDDLFFVGAWDRMPRLALDIRNSLAEFVCRHPGIHASAGIALIDGKYPLYQAAQDAHEALEAAKGREGKNALTFLGQTVAWDRFANDVKVHSDELTRLVRQNSVPRSLIQRLQKFQIQFQKKQHDARLRGQAENKQGEEQVVWGPWNWHAAYFLSRGKVKEVETLKNKLGDEQFRAIEWIGLSARWVDLLTR